MKKILILPFVCVLLCSCTGQNREFDIQAAAQRTMESYEPNAFVRADSDFVSTNFGTPEYLEEAAVYYTRNGDGTEFGFFRLSNMKYTADMEEKIRDYLKSEREAVASLAALYPAEELSTRLSRFDGATVGTAGNTVYYFLTEQIAVKNAFASDK